MPGCRVFVFTTGYILLACQSMPAKNNPPVGRVAQAGATTKPAETEKPAAAPTENPPGEPPRPVVIRRAFFNPYENEAFMRHIADEHKKFGTANRVKKYKKKKFGNSIIEQRSGRQRLYDHNIFLRALYAGELSVAGTNLKDDFEGALFFDIGSAILFGDGADTVRDLYEDKKVAPHLKIVASDINDAAQKKTRYVDIYRKTGEKLPFPVVEIAMMMKKPAHFQDPVKPFLTDSTAGVILRSANAGPDLYYESEEVQTHLRSAIAAFYERHMIYFFNKYILYKPRERESFVILGEIDPDVGINHRVPTWEDIDWATRTFREAVRPNPQYLDYQK
ncbi:MAG: hypothetical protein KF713_09935 [Turneriella sp.]|nr:hypothetical protein [Turneriella sp.]